MGFGILISHFLKRLLLEDMSKERVGAGFRTPYRFMWFGLELCIGLKGGLVCAFKMGGRYVLTT